MLLDENNECDIPWEAICEPGTLNVSVYSGDLITASVAPVQIHETGYAEYRETTSEASKDAFAQALGKIDGIVDDSPANRVSSLDSTALATDTVVEAVGTPTYVSDVSGYSDFGISETGWYIFARISAKTGTYVTADVTVEGSAGYIANVGDDYIDVAVRFEVASISQMIVINWGTYTENFVFKATDLAIRNLDYRVTFYVYDVDEFATWEYTPTTDTTFAEDKYYYTRDENGSYALANVVAGEEVPADAYYNHSKVTFEGMTRNITYRCNTPIDCPVVFNLPEIEDETHGCWFEIRFQHTGAFSSTLNVPEGVKVATEHTQAETKGMNMVDLHYTSVGGVKLWRFMNTHSSIPA